MGVATPDILAALHQQRNLLEQLIPLHEALAELRGDNPVHTLTLDHVNGNGVRKRAKKRRGKAKGGRPRKNAVKVHGEDLAHVAEKISRRKRKAKRVTGKAAKPAKGKRLRTQDYVMRVLQKAKKPLFVRDITNRALAAGWKTTGEAINVMWQSVYQMRRDGFLKQFGPKTPQGNLIGLPEWEAAVRAGEAYAEATT